MRLGVEYGVMELMKGGTIKNVAGEILVRMDIPRSPAS